MKFGLDNLCNILLLMQTQLPLTLILSRFVGRED
jgi:hypothetical protein